MVYESTLLKDLYNINSNAKLDCYILEDNDQGFAEKPAVIVVPGGGYQFVSKGEGDPVAVSFLLKGYNCFVLTYTVFPEKVDRPLYPQPQLELMAAFDYVYKNASKYHISAKKITLVGFSAGGHLVGSYSTLTEDKELLSTLNIKDSKHLKPRAICLAYAVVTLGIATHGGSRETLTKGDTNLIEKLSIEKHVDSTYPPTFIWQTIDDTCVPFENALLMEKALMDAKVDYELFRVSEGNHGLSIALNHKEASAWVDKCDKFFRKHF